MADKFEMYADSLESPFTNAAPVTPDSRNDLPQVSRGLYVGEAGAVEITLEGGATITLPILNAGVVHPIRVRRVHEAGTTATGIHIFW